MKQLLFLLSITIISCGTENQTSAFKEYVQPQDTSIMNLQEESTHTECSAEIVYDCPNGYVDGCLIADEQSENGLLTKYHACVKVSSTRGPPCEQEIELECDTIEQDACLKNPALAETHICILKITGTPN